MKMVVIYFGCGDELWYRSKKIRVSVLMQNNDAVIDLIAVHKDDNLIILNQSEIYYFEHKSRKTMIHTCDCVYESTKSLKYYEERLKSREYFRTHRSILVNLSKVDRCISCINYAYDLYFRDLKDVVPISRERARLLIKLLDI